MSCGDVARRQQPARPAQDITTAARVTTSKGPRAFQDSLHRHRPTRPRPPRRRRTATTATPQWRGSSSNCGTPSNKDAGPPARTRAPPTSPARAGSHAATTVIAEGDRGRRRRCVVPAGHHGPDPRRDPDARRRRHCRRGRRAAGAQPRTAQASAALDRKVRRLQQRLRSKQIAEWNRRGQWKPLIAIASQGYGVSAAGVYRMMMLESGGRGPPTAGRTRPLPVHGPRVGDDLERVARPQHLRRLVADPSSPSASAAAWPGIWPLTYRMAFSTGPRALRPAPEYPSGGRLSPLRGGVPRRGKPPALKFLQLTPGSARRVTTRRPPRP